jgi:phosphatidylserine/phosphatidylglycerophosphate/cardiolipin synthase-like enzyme
MEGLQRKGSTIGIRSRLRRIGRCAWLALAFAAAISRAVAAAVPSATIETCFAPESDCAALAVRAIERAAHEILVGAYGLTTGSGIVEALLRAHRRGVDVKLLVDKTTPCGRNSGIDPLASAGVPVWIDHIARIAHAKNHGDRRRGDIERIL